MDEKPSHFPSRFRPITTSAYHWGSKGASSTRFPQLTPDLVVQPPGRLDVILLKGFFKGCSSTLSNTLKVNRSDHKAPLNTAPCTLPRRPSHRLRAGPRRLSNLSTQSREYYRVQTVWKTGQNCNGVVRPVPHRPRSITASQPIQNQNVEGHSG